MKLSKNDLPIRDFKLALLCGTVWMFLFWAVEYPMDEWAATVVVLYVCLWVSREITVRVVAFVTELLARQARGIMAGIGASIAGDDLSEEHGVRLRMIFVGGVFGILMLATVVGASVTAGIPIAILLGLAPLPLLFSWIGWALLGLGLAGLSLVLGGLALVFSITEAILNDREVVLVRAIMKGPVASASKIAAS